MFYMDGLEVMCLICFYLKEVFIVVLIVFVFEFDKDRVIEVGCDDFLIKLVL